MHERDLEAEAADAAYQEHLDTMSDEDHRIRSALRDQKGVKAKFICVNYDGKGEPPVEGRYVSEDKQFYFSYPSPFFVGGGEYGKYNVTEVESGYSKYFLVLGLQVLGVIEII